MNELVAWLRAQVDEDERVAKLVHGRTGQQIVVDLPEYVDEETSLHRKVVVFDPVRVLAEVAAKRRIIDRHSERVLLGEDGNEEPDPTSCGHCMDTWPCADVRDLASVYAGRPGWREEWAADEEENHG